MKHRIAAGVIVENEGRILLVRQRKAGAYDFWVAPGGGALDGEDLLTTARREAFEECGLRIEPVQLAYVEAFFNPHLRECKLWFIGRLIGGSLDCSSDEAATEHIVAADWLSRSEFDGKTIFPSVLLNEYWHDKEHGFKSPRYIGLREMEF